MCLKKKTSIQTEPVTKSYGTFYSLQVQMYQQLIFILFILNGDLIGAASVADSWILFAKALKDSWIRCPVEVSL